jgi:hypothetical protein
MRLIAVKLYPSKLYEVELSLAEFAILSQVVARAADSVGGKESLCNAIGITGETADAMQAFFREVYSLIESDPQQLPAPSRLPSFSGGDPERPLMIEAVQLHRHNATLSLGRGEAAILVKLLGEMANGICIPEWEFRTLVGVSRRDVRDLLESIHLVLVMQISDRRQGPGQ